MKRVKLHRLVQTGQTNHVTALAVKKKARRQPEYSNSPTRANKASSLCEVCVVEREWGELRVH